jgi:molecular chaperone GrpE
MTQGPEHKNKINIKNKGHVKSGSSSGKDDKNPVTHTEKQADELDDKISLLLKDVKTRDSEIASLKERNKEYKNEYLRQVAERDNLRKRLEREKAEYFQYAMSDIFKEFLGILDNFERALDSQESLEKERSFREGVEMIHRQIEEMLRKYDVTPIKEDKTFDPNLHQAFMTEESTDVMVPEISSVFQKGYMLGARLLRPALVKVTIPKKEKD